MKQVNTPNLPNHLAVSHNYPKLKKCAFCVSFEFLFYFPFICNSWKTMWGFTFKLEHILNNPFHADDLNRK